MAPFPVEDRDSPPPEQPLSEVETLARRWASARVVLDEARASERDACDRLNTATKLEEQAWEALWEASGRAPPKNMQATATSPRIR